MDRMLQFLHGIIIYLHILAGIAIMVKTFFIFRTKGFDIPAVVTSFFRLYTKSDLIMSHNLARRQYMKLNNWINYYIYSWMLITLIIIVVFHQPY
jgi:hypothetical protein